jgi:Zn finger protein HypA/HybF involved in hydrogenase expression
MTLLRGLGVEELTQAELTGEWEHKLSQIERGRLKRDEFMREIAQMTQQIVKRAKEYDNDTIPGDYATLDTPCPQCGGQVKENYRRFACTACEFSISKIPGGRQFEIEEVEELLLKKEIGPLQGFRSKMGRPFAAILKLAKDDDGNWKMEFDFGQNDDEGDGEPVDFSEQTPVGKCPKCGGSVYEHGMKYVCENAGQREDLRLHHRQDHPAAGNLARADRQAADRRQDRPADRLQVVAYGRNFKAFLVKQPDGKIGFEFEARSRRRRAAAKTAKPAAKSAAKAESGACKGGRQEGAGQEGRHEDGDKDGCYEDGCCQEDAQPQSRQPTPKSNHHWHHGKKTAGREPRRFHFAAVICGLFSVSAARCWPSSSRKSMKARPWSAGTCGSDRPRSRRGAATGTGAGYASAALPRCSVVPGTTTASRCPYWSAPPGAPVRHCCTAGPGESARSPRLRAGQRPFVLGVGQPHRDGAVVGQVMRVAQRRVFAQIARRGAQDDFGGDQRARHEVRAEPEIGQHHADVAPFLDDVDHAVRKLHVEHHLGIQLLEAFQVCGSRCRPNMTGVTSRSVPDSDWLRAVTIDSASSTSSRICEQRCR